MSKRAIDLSDNPEGLLGRRKESVTNWVNLCTKLDELHEFIIAAHACHPGDIGYREQERLVQRLDRLSRAVRAEVDRVIIEAEEYWATHWRDDDTPQYERTFGTRRPIGVAA